MNVLMTPIIPIKVSTREKRIRREKRKKKMILRKRKKCKREKKKKKKRRGKIHIYREKIHKTNKPKYANKKHPVKRGD